MPRRNRVTGSARSKRDRQLIFHFPGRASLFSTTGEEAVAEAEEGSFHGDMEESCPKQGNPYANPERGIAIVIDTKRLQGLMSKVDQLFMREIERIGEIGDPPGEAGGGAGEEAGGA